MKSSSARGNAWCLCALSLALGACGDGLVQGLDAAADTPAPRHDGAVDGAPDRAADSAQHADATPAPDGAQPAMDGAAPDVPVVVSDAQGCGAVGAPWQCTGDGQGRQRCVAGAVQSEHCAHGCANSASGLDDVCTPDCAGSASGSTAIWTCTADSTERQRCVAGAVQSEHCTGGCVRNASGVDDVCGAGCSMSASGTSGVWTCSTDRAQRQRCVSGAVQSERCASGCVPQPVGTDDYCASGTGCAGSASGTTAIWTCTSDHAARQRCVSNAVQTEACPYGCAGRPTGTDDVCNPMPAPGSGQVSCAYPQWWNVNYSWNPGYYAVSYGWDNDLALAAGTPVQLRHSSRLEAEGVYAWGWMPEFTDLVTGQRFRFLHLQPARRLTTGVGMTYAAGTLVGYSGGNTADTGYCVAIPGCGTPNCATATCVYSTGAHLCVQTRASYRTAFPMGTDACR